MLIGWHVTAVVLLVWIWAGIGRCDPAATKADATRQDDSRPTTFLLVVAASLASLVGVALALVKAKDESGTMVVWLTAAAIVTVVLSWALVHTIFVLRYAHLYYLAPEGGVDFPSHEDPDFVDFAYLSFTIGMTFQVSDTDLSARDVRRVALRHALISYLFGAVIVAVTINVIAGLFK